MINDGFKIKKIFALFVVISLFIYLLTPIIFLVTSETILGYNNPYDASSIELSKKKLQVANLLTEYSRRIHYYQRSDLILGRIYFISKNYEKSLKYYSTYLLFSKNPLRLLEAYYVLLDYCTLTTNYERCIKDYKDYFVKIDHSTYLNLTQTAYDYFYDQEFQKSEYLLKIKRDILGERLNEIDSTILLISEILNGKSYENFDNLDNYRWGYLSKNLNISGNDFYWLDGRKVSQVFPEYQEQSKGYFWFSEYTFYIVYVIDEGEYIIDLTILDNSPSPIEFELSFNFNEKFEYLLTTGDDEWVTFNDKVHLPSGFNVIFLKFLNDGLVDGKDRNGVIDSLRIRRY